MAVTADDLLAASPTIVCKVVDALGVTDAALARVTATVTLTKRTFKNQADLDAAMIDYKKLCAKTDSAKAWRFALSDDPSAVPVFAAWKKANP